MLANFYTWQLRLSESDQQRPFTVNNIPFFFGDRHLVNMQMSEKDDATDSSDCNPHLLKPQFNNLIDSLFSRVTRQGCLHMVLILFFSSFFFRRKFR
jgi:hypothetical protein